MKEALLTVPQREALHRFVEAGGVVFVNSKKNGFDQFHARDALALIIGNLAVVEMGELHLSLLGQMLTSSEIPVAKREGFVDWFVNRGPEFP